MPSVVKIIYSSPPFYQQLIRKLYRKGERKQTTTEESIMSYGVTMKTGSLAFGQRSTRPISANFGKAYTSAERELAKKTAQHVIASHRIGIDEVLRGGEKHPLMAQHNTHDSIVLQRFVNRHFVVIERLEAARISADLSGISAAEAELQNTRIYVAGLEMYPEEKEPILDMIALFHHTLLIGYGE